MFCIQCGNNIPDGAAFCQHCGAQQIVEEKKPQPAAPKQKGGTGSVLLGIVLGILLIIVLIVGILVALFMFQHRGGFVTSSKEPTSAVQDEDVSSSSALPQDNDFLQCFESYADYVLTESNSRYYTYQEIIALSREACVVARQEIYARHGQRASDRELQDYFDARDWFTAGGDGAVTLNDWENANLILLDVRIHEFDNTLRNTGNVYIQYAPSPDSYFLPGSDSRFLTAQDLKGLSAEALCVARNEIFARHGFIFEAQDLLTYFYSMHWYTPVVKAADFDSSVLNEFEQGNIELIQIYEDMCDGVSMSPSNPYISYLNYYPEYMLIESNTRLVTSYDVWEMGLDALCLARNEILARHGYTFKDQDLLEFFLQRDWYYPSTPPGRSDLVSLSSTESKNVTYIKDLENAIKADSGG